MPARPLLRPQVVVAVLAAALLVYLVLVGLVGVRLIASGSAVGVVLGVAVLVIPLVGAWVVWREVEFGRGTSRLAAELDAAGRWPTEELPTRPSGRPQREAADALFARRRTEVEESPDDWGAWFRLGLAYEDAGDRRRARSALRHALALHERDAGTPAP